MKVLLFAEACAAGVGRHVADLARGLAAAAHDVHLVYSPEHADRAFLNGVKGLPAHALSVKHNPHPRDMVSALALRRYAARNGPFDAIHAHSTKAGFLARTALAGLPGARIYTPHAPLTMNPSIQGVTRRILAGCEKLLSRWTDRIVAVSEEEFDHLHELGIPREKLALVPNGIDAPDASPAGSHAEPPNRPPCIGFLGRLARQKNLSLLLEAFAQLQTDAVLAIAGTGPMEPELRRQAARLGIASSIQWLGQCDASILQNFDVFALPSLYEGLPYVLLEAMAAGLPVVSTRVGGVSLLVGESVNGFTVPVGDAAAFADALRPLVHDAALRRRMGRASRERVAQFTISKMVAGVVDVYSQSITRPSLVFAKPFEAALKPSR